MKTVFSVPVMVVALAACTSRPLTIDDNLIVPGERVGEVEIGMPLSQLVALKGQPIKTVPIEGTAATTYAFDGFVVGADDEVYWIIAQDARFRTANGIAPGTEQIQARAAMGRPDCVASRGEITRYDYGNVYFDVENASGKVKTLGVQKKTSTCEG